VLGVLSRELFANLPVHRMFSHNPLFDALALRLYSRFGNVATIIHRLVKQGVCKLPYRLSRFFAEPLKFQIPVVLEAEMHH